MDFDFYKRLELICQHLPYGKVVTYGQLASLCERPKNARQVGYALRTSKSKKPLPAYRIVNSSGFLSGSPCFSTPTIQRYLLQKEDIIVYATSKCQTLIPILKQLIAWELDL